MQAKNHAIMIATKDNDEEMGKFYTEMLGFTKNDLGGYAKDNLSVYFEKHSEAALKAKEPFRHMITMEVDDIQAVFEELKSKGIEFVREPEADRHGTFATFVDPDGNYLQVFQMPSE